MKRPIEILHVADLHLDTPFDRMPDELAAKLRQCQRDELAQIAHLARIKAVDLVFFSGDIVDGNKTYPETARAFHSMLEDISVPVFIAPGNHDYLASGSFLKQLTLPDHVHLFETETLTPYTLPDLEVQVWGAGFTQPHVPPLLSQFSVANAPETVPEYMQLLCMHGDALNADSAYNPVKKEDVANSGFQYIALGHAHSYSGLLKSGPTFYAWPGCIQGRGFDECGEKGVILACVSKAETKLSFLPLSDTPRFEIFNVALEDLPEAEYTWAKSQDKTCLARIILTGETQHPPNLRSLRERLTPLFTYLELVDETTLPQSDIWETAEEDTLRSIFVQKLKIRLLHAQTEEEKQLILAAAQWGKKALDHWDAP